MLEDELRKLDELKDDGSLINLQLGFWAQFWYILYNILFMGIMTYD